MSCGEDSTAVDEPVEASGLDRLRAADPTDADAVLDAGSATLTDLGVRLRAVGR